MFEVRVEAGFEAGHHRGPEGEELPLHHHHWQIAARARSQGLDHVGLVIDFRVLRAAIDEVLGELDQRVLEDTDAFRGGETTAPAVAAWIYGRLDERMRRVIGVENGTEPDRGHEFWLDAVEVESDAGIRFEYRPPQPVPLGGS